MNKTDQAKEIIFFSRFQPKGDADGGFRRTAQIVEALDGLGFSFVSVMDFYPEFYAAGYLDGPQYKEYLSDSPLPPEYIEKWNPRRRNNIAYLHHVSWVWMKRINESGSMPKLAIVDDPIYFSPLIEFLYANHVPIIANCHNVEALSRSQLTEEHQLSLFNREIEILSRCSLAITISREETVLLRNLDIPAFYYPYFPVKGPYDRMLAIREKRKGTTKKDFLMLGTANNPPTMAGMMDVIKIWKEIGNTMNGAKLYVGGYGSDPLKELADGKHVVYKGVLTNEELDEMLCSSKACIVYQGDGSGALTKICECLLADVPVIANSHAARSYYHLPGIVEFSDIYDLAKASALVNSLDMPTAAPTPPDATSLLLRVKELKNEDGHLKQDKVKSLVNAILTKSDEIEGTNNYTSGLKKIVQEAIREHDNRLRDECRAISSERDAITAERDAITAHRDALLNSLSWRITAPLRWIGSIFTRR